MDTGEARLRFEAAGHLYESQQFLECLEILGELDLAFPLKKSIMLSMARCLYKLNRTDESLDVCSQILDTYDYPAAERLRNRILRQHGSRTESGLHNDPVLRPFDIDSTPAFGSLSDSEPRS